MSKAEVIRPYVEKTVAELIGSDHVDTMPDGTIPIRTGRTVMYVRLIDFDPPFLRVFSPVVKEIDKTKKLLERLNQLNSSTPFGRMFWVDREVIVSVDILATDMDKDEIKNAMAFVSDTANFLDEEFIKEFGGTLMFPDEEKTPAEGDGESEKAGAGGTKPAATKSRAAGLGAKAGGAPGDGKPEDPDKDGFSAGYI